MVFEWEEVVEGSPAKSLDFGSGGNECVVAEVVGGFRLQCFYGLEMVFSIELPALRLRGRLF